MKTLEFSNNDSMPIFGLGTWKSKTGEVYNAVKTAIKLGCRHIDCAPIYGNEKEVGIAISECLKEGIVTRKELWITSKLWNNAHAKNDVIPALKETLSDLQLDYLDLYLIHWPVAFKSDVMMSQSSDDMLSLVQLPLSQTWEGMEDAVRLGLADHIGVSNFGIKTLGNLIASAKIKPEVNQVECHPYFQQKELLNYCQKENIHLTAYSPLGSFDRSDAMKAGDEPTLLKDAKVSQIAQAKNASVAQILITWAIHRGISVIPKSVNTERISQNLAAEKIQLSDAEMSEISDLDRNYRYVKGDFWIYEDGPYTLDNLWA